MSDPRWGSPDDSEGLGPHDPYRGPDSPPPQEPTWFASAPGPTNAWSATLEDLAIQSERSRSQARAKRRMVIIGAVVLIAIVVAGSTALVIYVTGSRNNSSATPAGWCSTGTEGSVTTTSSSREPTTPTGVVAAFVGAAIDDRSAVRARANLSEAAAVPTVAQLQQWISALPASTNGWCAQITTTESTARLLVTLRIRTDTGIAQVGAGDTFYVSETGPDRWAIDAIVSGDGT